MSLGLLYVLLGELFVQVLCPFYNCIVCLLDVHSCEFFIHFGDQTLVRDTICKYIFPYVCFPFHFADVFFSHAAFYFDKVPSVYSFLYVFFLALEGILVKILLGGISEIFLPMFSCRTFMVS